MKQGVMWLLTLVAVMRGFTLFDKVTGPQAIETDVVLFQHGCHLIMRHELEFLASVKWVLVSPTNNTAQSRVVGTCSTGHYGLAGGETLLEEARLISR